MNGRKPIKVISFDGDITLWDFEKVMRHSLSVTLAELRRHIPGHRESTTIGAERAGNEQVSKTTIDL